MWSVVAIFTMQRLHCDQLSSKQHVDIGQTAAFEVGDQLIDYEYKGLIGVPRALLILNLISMLCNRAN